MAHQDVCALYIQFLRAEWHKCIHITLVRCWHLDRTRYQHLSAINCIQVVPKNPLGLVSRDCRAITEE